jgi:hypothetical protein
MIGLEDEPTRRGEICIFEVFGDTVEGGGAAAAVGMGIKRIRDPRLEQDFEAPTLEIDVSESHDYAVEWRSGASTGSSTAITGARSTKRQRTRCR